MFKLNRCLALLVIFSVAVTAFAADQDGQSNGKMWDGKKKHRSTTGVMDFEAIKEKRLEKLTLKMEQLSNFRNCVSEATDQAAMAICQTENRAANKALGGPNKGQIDADGIRKRFKGTN